MHNPYIPDTIKIAARKLRKNMTNSEKKLWNELKNQKLGVKFMRQRPLYTYTEDSWLDRYIIPDFCCLDKMLLIEIDWWVHLKNDVLELDKHKEKLIVQKWYTLLRFTNDDVNNNIGWVIKIIRNTLS